MYITKLFYVSKTRMIIFRYVVLLFLMPLFTFSQEAELISFDLKDQFDRIYTDKDYKGSIFIVVGSDKGGSKYNPIWSAAIYNELKNESVNKQLKLAGIADLGSVPFFLKGFIKNKFPKEREKWVLMDWKGIFAKAYKFKSGMSNILIFDHDGRLVYQTTAKEMDDKKLVEIIQKIIAFK